MKGTAFELFCRRLGQVCILMGVVLVAVCGVELMMRGFYEPEPVRRVFDPYAYRIPQPRLVDRFTGLDGKEVTVRLNELGMRGPPISTPPEAGTVTLVFLGGSTTENYALPRHETFPELTGRQVAERLGRPVRVFNAGASAATTATSLGRLQHQVLDLEPDLVVVMHGINDLVGGFHPDFRRDGRHLPRPALATDIPTSYLVDWLRRRHIGPTTPSPKATFAVDDFTGFPALDVFERNLQSMAAVAAAHDVPILFLTQATMYRQDPAPSEVERMQMVRRTLAARSEIPDIPSLARGMEAFNDVVRGLHGLPGVRVFDLARRVPRTEKMIFDECHLTRAGNHRAAEELAPIVESLIATGRDVVAVSHGSP